MSVVSNVSDALLILLREQHFDTSIFPSNFYNVRADNTPSGNISENTMLNIFSAFQILALHGYRQSDVTFSAKLGSLRKGFKREIDFTFIRAPHEVPSTDGNDESENGKI